MDYDIKFKPLPAIQNNLGVNSSLNFLTAQTVHKLSYKYTPFDTGNLANNVRIYSTGEYGVIHYLSPYAKKIYHGDDLNFNKEKHALSTSYWDKAMYLNEGTKLIRIIDGYRKGLSK